MIGVSASNFSFRAGFGITPTEGPVQALQIMYGVGSVALISSLRLCLTLFKLGGVLEKQSKYMLSRFTFWDEVVHKKGVIVTILLS